MRKPVSVVGSTSGSGDRATLRRAPRRVRRLRPPFVYVCLGHTPGAVDRQCWVVSSASFVEAGHWEEPGALGATTTRFRPAALAAYRARSASFITPSAVPVLFSSSAMPRLAVI